MSDIGLIPLSHVLPPVLDRLARARLALESAPADAVAALQAEVRVLRWLTETLPGELIARPADPSEPAPPQY